MEHSYLVSSGPRCGLRESRCIIGEYTLTKEDVKTSRKTDQGIGRGGWGAEPHTGNEETSWGMERGAKYFDIPVGTLRSKGMKNLWNAGRSRVSRLRKTATKMNMMDGLFAMNLFVRMR